MALLSLAMTAALLASVLARSGGGLFVYRSPAVSDHPTSAVREDGPPETLPEPPYALPPPARPSPRDDGRDLDRMSGRALYAAACAAARAGADHDAIRFGEWAVLSGGRGELLLARSYARVPDVDSAIYWLQRAAIEEGIDPGLVLKHDDLAVVRADPRWPELKAFVDRTSRYWAAHGGSSLVIIAPGARRRAHRALVVLHEDGTEPSEFLDHERYRRWAQRLGVVFVGVSGTIPLGPKAYRWSPLPDENVRRVADALAEAKRRARVDDDRVMLLGFGEGAQAALETAARDPDQYRGAIALSPGGVDWHLREVPADARVARQTYVVAFGNLESFDTVGTSYVDVDLLRALGAKVVVHVSWFYALHTVPPDFDVRLPQWLDMAFRERVKKPPRQFGTTPITGLQREGAPLD